MNTQAILETGELLFKQGKLREAEAQFLTVIEHDPNNKVAYNNLGVIAFSQREHKKAISHFRKAIDIDPVYMDAIVNVCDVLRSIHSLTEALPVIRRAIALNPENEGLRKLVMEENSENKRRCSDRDAEGADAVQRERGRRKTGIPVKNMIRVLHLPLVIANTAITLSKYLNRLGVESKVISYFRTWLNYRGDINLDLDGLNSADRNKKVKEFVDYFFENEAHKYDIFNFHFFESLSTGSSFGGWKSHQEREDYWDLQKLKDMGKKIVVSSWGSDLRNNSKFIYYQLRYENVTEDIPYPPLNRKEQYLKLWKFAQYADAVVHGDSELVKHAPYGTMIPISIDTELFDRQADEETAAAHGISIVHAPSNQLYKGTAYVDEVLQKIALRYGDKVEIRKIHGISHQEAMRNYRGYGAAIDQIGSMSFGLFALEAHYLGRTVFTSFHAEEFLDEDPKMRTPVIAVKNQEDFHERLVDFLDSDIADHTGGQRQFILDNFSTAVIAEQYRDLYERLVSGETIKQYVSREWYGEFSRLLANQKIDVRNFYPKVTDVLLQRRQFAKLFHEIRMGSGLNDDVDLLAKYLFALEVTGQKDQEVAARRANQALLTTDRFSDRYARAKEVYGGMNSTPGRKL